LLFFGRDKNDGVRHHLFDWGNVKVVVSFKKAKKIFEYVFLKIAVGITTRIPKIIVSKNIFLCRLPASICFY
jgi:hypothetical protein